MCASHGGIPVRAHDVIQSVRLIGKLVMGEAPGFCFTGTVPADKDRPMAEVVLTNEEPRPAARMHDQFTEWPDRALIRLCD